MVRQSEEVSLAYMRLMEDENILIKRGIEEGIEEGRICGMIESMLELGVDRARLEARLMEKFSLSRDEAEEYLEKYSN